MQRRVASVCLTVLALLGPASIVARAQDVIEAQASTPRASADVHRELQRQQSVLSQCFNAARQDDREFAAILSLSLSVEQDGSVSDARIVDGFVPLDSAGSFEECVVLAARRFALGPGRSETLQQSVRFGHPLAPGTQWRLLRSFRPPVIRCADCGYDGGSIVGSLSTEVIRRTMGQQRPAARACYERELPRNPRLSGRAVLRFVIAPSGVVINAVVAESRFGKPEPRLERCLVAVATSLRFPAIDGGGHTVVTHPYVFKREPRSRHDARGLVLDSPTCCFDPVSRR